MRALRGTQTTHGEGGWRLYLTPPGGARVELSLFRGVPVGLGGFDDEDPFAWGSTELTFDTVSFFDTLGHGDLDWAVDGADVELEWDGELPVHYPYEKFVYEGFTETFKRSSAGLTVTVSGATHQLDHPKTKPEHTIQPIPYEVAIRRVFEGNPHLRVKAPVIEWPDWWDVLYHPEPNRNTAFIPSGVRTNQPWTAMVTRNTGAWESALDYIRTLLGGMFTSRGRWTLDLDPGRRAVLRHRAYKTAPDAETVVLDLTSATVDGELTEDWSQTGNVWYGQGKSLQGAGYSGMEVSVDGARTRYRPLAAARQVEPETDRNGWLQTERLRREVVLQLPDGLDQAQAEKVGSFQYRHFSEPGHVGTLTISSAVRMYKPTATTELGKLIEGDVLPHWCLRAGMSAWVPYYNGTGIFLHIAKVSRDAETGDVTLTVDSKYRDYLTIDELRNRRRDALSVPRLLLGGQYKPALSDQLVPWSYAEGSGYVPSGPDYSSQRLFEGMPDDVVFPWQEWTTSRPPNRRAWKSCYIPIGAKSSDATKNWATNTDRGGGKMGFPIRMAQAATIRLVQIAAYNGDGEVLSVPFHVSLYSSNGVNIDAMPIIPGPNPVDGHAVGQRYPFFQGAWEKYNASGTQIGNEVTVAVESSGFVRGWGTGRVKAGFWPGSDGSHNPTGLLVDTEGFQIQAPTSDGSGDWGINPYSQRQLATYAGYLYLMVYCEADEPVYFAGRMFRAEPEDVT